MLGSGGPPVFVLGSPRSGTTLLRLMLTCHRHIVVPPECGFCVWLYPQFQDWSWNPRRLEEEFVPSLIRCRKFDTWDADPEELASFVSRHRPSSYRDLASSVYAYYGQRAKR